MVTLLERAERSAPMMVDGRVILETGSSIVWFTYPGRWHDIGRFHRADGTFTGFYANVLTPVLMDGPRWDTTDLFLDIWMGADGAPGLLDEDELEAALAAGWIDERTANRAREEAAELLKQAGDGIWPPPEVLKWTLERASESPESK